MVRAVLLLLLAAQVRVEGPEERARWFREAVPRLLAEVEGALGMRHAGPIRVRLARTDEEFARLAGRHPSWVAAVALPRDSSLIVRLPALGPGGGTDAASVIRHELVHVLLPGRLGWRGDLPKWFEEGLAQVLGARVNRLDLATLPASAAAGTLIPLHELEDSFPRDGGGAALAYAEGESAVSFLVERRGPDGLRRILDGVRETGSFEAALRRETGLTMPEFTAAWKDWLAEEGDPWWVALILPAFLPFLLFVSSLLVIAAFFRARRRGKDTYESLPE